MIDNNNSYYSASVNPTYASIWYNSLIKKSHSNNDAYFDIIADPDKSKRPEQFQDNNHHNRISPIALKKIKSAIDYLVYLAQPKHLPHTMHGRDFKFKVSFITLTLSSAQVHDDITIKTNILEPMLNCLRQKHKVKSYLWRAERQANGNIHFHIVCDQFIPWAELRNDWNKYQQNLGYVTRYREAQRAWHAEGFRFRQEMGHKWFLSDQYKAWLKGVRSDWASPNSSDIHSLKNVKNIKNYFVKYLTNQPTTETDYINGLALKKEVTKETQLQGEDIKGRLWGCSENLSNLKGARIEFHSDFPEDLNRVFQDKRFHKHHGDYFSVIFYTPDQLQKWGYGGVLQVLEEFCRQQFPEYRPPNLFENKHQVIT